MHAASRQPTVRRPAAAKRHVHGQLEALLLGRERPEGDLLGDEALAARLGTSRTPVREALLRPEGERLIRLVPRRGAFAPLDAPERFVACDRRFHTTERTLVCLRGGR